MPQGHQRPDGHGIASIGSGSSGNGTLVSFPSALFLIDCGFTLKQSWARLNKAGVDPEQLSALLVTHEHSDHVGGVATLANRFRIPVYASYGTAKRLRSKNLSADLLNCFDAGSTFAVDGVDIRPVAVPHDARQPTQFVLADGSQRIGVITDIGHVTPHVVAEFSGLSQLIMESNHDPQMLRDGSYPPRLKARVGGDFGHLSNTQAVEFLESVLHPGLARVVVGHVSEQNNSPHHLEAAFARLRDSIADLRFATQREGSAWFG